MLGTPLRFPYGYRLLSLQSQFKCQFLKMILLILADIWSPYNIVSLFHSTHHNL